MAANDMETVKREVAKIPVEFVFYYANGDTWAYICLSCAIPWS